MRARINPPDPNLTAAIREEIGNAISNADGS